MNDAMFFSDIEKLAGVGIASISLYVLVVLMIRLFGKRSTSQMNNFDWIVTVSIGSIMASGTLLNSVTIAQSATAIFVLLSLQWIVTKLSVVWRGFSDFIRAEPTILVENGEYCRAAMRKQRVSEAEIQAAIRQQGVPDLSDIRWVILESNAGITVLGREETKSLQQNILGPSLGRDDEIRGRGA